MHHLIPSGVSRGLLPQFPSPPGEGCASLRHSVPPARGQGRRMLSWQPPASGKRPLPPVIAPQLPGKRQSGTGAYFARIRSCNQQLPRIRPGVQMTLTRKENAAPETPDRVQGILVGLCAGDRIGGPTRMALELAEYLLTCGRAFRREELLERYVSCSLAHPAVPLHPPGPPHPRTRRAAARPRAGSPRLPSARDLPPATGARTRRPAPAARHARPLRRLRAWRREREPCRGWRKPPGKPEQCRAKFD